MGGRDRLVVLVFTLHCTLLLGASLTGGVAAAQPQQGAEDPVVRVATKEAPPFSFRSPDGEWRGLGVEAWGLVANELGLRYELIEATVPEMIDGLQAGTFDVAATGLTLTAERERVIDFSVPILRSGLGVATRKGLRLGWLGVVRGVLSPAFLQVLAALSAILLVAGWLVWLFERRENAEEFGGAPHQGLASGFWWAAVTMTTVGYGDKAPKTLGGRIVALVWMFVSLVVIGGYVASMASTLTIGGITPRFETASDLYEVRVGVIEGTVSQQYAREKLLTDRGFPDVEAALVALESGEIDAVIHDRPILRHAIAAGGHLDLEVLPLDLTEGYYGIAFQEGSELRESFDRGLLEMWSNGRLDQVRRRYLPMPDER